MNRIQPDTTLPRPTRISTLRGILQFTIADTITFTEIQNTTNDTSIIVAKFATGKYNIQTNGIFTANKTFIHPEISSWASIPLSKTTWGDYNYHFIRASDGNVDIYCQKTSDNTYHDFTDIFDGIEIPVHIEIYY